MPAPIIPAPRTRDLADRARLRCPAGRLAPELTAWRSKKNAWIMFLAIWPVTSSVK